MAYAGACGVYASGEGLFSRLLGIAVSAAQVYRVTVGAGASLPESGLYAGKPHEGSEVVYGMVDGSMLFTDDGWKEAKVGRVFGASARKEVGKEGCGVAAASDYCACLGGHETFKPKMEALLSRVPQSKMVLVSDGCAWIGRWFTEKYPHATHILDYFHAVEHLSEAAKGAGAPAGWLPAQSALLKESRLGEVIANVRRMKGMDAAKKEKLLQYYENNKYRMDYAAYLAKGLSIGSGAIESAHRTLLQQRMKLSGQRWGGGADQLIKLRVAMLSGKTELIDSLFRVAA